MINFYLTLQTIFCDYIIIQQIKLGEAQKAWYLNVAGIHSTCARCLKSCYYDNISW